MNKARESKRYKSSYEWQHAHLEKHRGKAGISDTCVEPIVELLLPRYAEADAEAIRNQWWFTRAAVVVYALSAAAITIAISQRLFWEEAYGLIWLEVLAMMVALLMIYLGNRCHWHRRWLDARHLAEQLRTAMFVLIVPGEPNRTGRRPVQALPFYESPNPRLQESVRQALNDERLEACAVNDVQAVKRYLIDAWIRDQELFHEKNANKRHQQSHGAHLAVVILFVLTVAAAALHAMHLCDTCRELENLTTLVNLAPTLSPL